VWLAFAPLSLPACSACADSSNLREDLLDQRVNLVQLFVQLFHAGRMAIQLLSHGREVGTHFMELIRDDGEDVGVGCFRSGRPAWALRCSSSTLAPFPAWPFR
jgi:hypothetical protein